MCLQRTNEIIRHHGYERSCVIAMLQDIQQEAGYLPATELQLLAGRVGMPISRVHSLATFYRAFSLEPRGRHIVGVCLGTACHVRGGGRVMDKVCRDLRVEPGGTTADRRYTVESVRCVGCCGLAPVVVVDGDFHGKLNQQKVVKMLRKYK